MMDDGVVALLVPFAVLSVRAQARTASGRGRASEATTSKMPSPRTVVPEDAADEGAGGQGEGVGGA